MDLVVGVSKLDSKGEEVHFSSYNEIENGHVAGDWLRVSRRELDAQRSTGNSPVLKFIRAYISFIPVENVTVIYRFLL
jgi:hypothetical protein